MGDSVQRVVGVGERQEVRRHLQRARHLGATHDQAAEQKLREHERRHELHGLELGVRERAQEEPK
jgi:hypothetical protein